MDYEYVNGKVDSLQVQINLNDTKIEQLQKRIKKLQER